MADLDLIKQIEGLDKSLINLVPDNFITIKLSYSTTLLFPYKEGIAFAELLAKAQYISNSYRQPQTISDHSSEGEIEIGFLSAQKYKEIRIAQLLKTTPDNVRAALAGELEENDNPE